MFGSDNVASSSSTPAPYRPRIGLWQQFSHVVEPEKMERYQQARGDKSGDLPEASYGRGQPQDRTKPSPGIQNDYSPFINGPEMSQPSFSDFQKYYSSFGAPSENMADPSSPVDLARGFAALGQQPPRNTSGSAIAERSGQP